MAIRRWRRVRALDPHGSDQGYDVVIGNVIALGSTPDRPQIGPMRPVRPSHRLRFLVTLACE